MKEGIGCRDEAFGLGFGFEVGVVGVLVLV